MSVVLKRGCAPGEQYRSQGEQGPWTDVYAICATIYRLITENLPMDAMERLHKDSLAPPTTFGISIPMNVETALLKGLNINGDARYQSMEELCAGIYDGQISQAPFEEPINFREVEQERALQSDSIIDQRDISDRSNKNLKNKVLIMCGGVAAFSLIILFRVILTNYLSVSERAAELKSPHPTPAESNYLSVLEQAAEQPRHAPNMYVDWVYYGEYDIMTVDWYCEQDARDTYWAVHNWYEGYAGFQNVDGDHVLLLSWWDLDNGTKPTIEYSRDGTSGEIDEEGVGKHVFTNYGWQTGKWYTMRVQVWTVNGKSYFGQRVREDGGEWVKTAVISYPVANLKFNGGSMSQGDFGYNNLSRKCRLNNAYGRFCGTINWDSWSNYKISNTYFSTSPPTWDNVLWNVNYDCDWGIESGSSYVWVQSGGGDFTSIEKTAPATYKTNQASKPAYSDWINVDEPEL